MSSNATFFHAAWSLLRERYKSLFVSHAKLKQEADEYASVCKGAWRVARDVSAELRELEAQCHLVIEGGSFSSDAAKLSPAKAELQTLLAKHCPPELTITINSLQTLFTYLASTNDRMPGLDAKQCAEVLIETAKNRAEAEQIEAQLVVNARHAANAADRFVGY